LFEVVFVTINTNDERNFLILTSAILGLYFGYLSMKNIKYGIFIFGTFLGGVISYILYILIFSNSSLDHVKLFYSLM